MTESPPIVQSLERIVEIASAAGAAIMQHYGANGLVDVKEDGTPLTAADRAAHAVIATELARFTPDVPIISEEGEIPPYEVRRHWTRFWLVDPLDGTKEFVKRIGEFTVNIALIEEGVPSLGVVLAPALGLTYFAAQGHGAWRKAGDGRPERIYGRPRPDGVTRVVESRSHPSPALEAFIATLGPVIRERLGSSLKFCRVAEGGADVYPRFGPINEWDVAAGDCVYRYSGPGGTVRPSPLKYNQPTLTLTEGFVIGDDLHEPATVPRA
jgi:3'(2'), 5'-bisphosphate nucleotidase